MSTVELQKLLLSCVAFEAVKCETWSLVCIRLQVHIWGMNVFCEVNDSELCYRIINFCQISYVKQIYGAELNKYINYTFLSRAL